MCGEAAQRFWASTHVGDEEWRDGAGYDLAALREFDPAERAKAEDFLVRRSGVDWRDIDALDALGSERALIAIECSL